MIQYGVLQCSAVQNKECHHDITIGAERDNRPNGKLHIPCSWEHVVSNGPRIVISANLPSSYPTSWMIWWSAFCPPVIASLAAAEGWHAQALIGNCRRDNWLPTDAVLGSACGMCRLSKSFKPRLRHLRKETRCSNLANSPSLDH
jgi:hypothetical protein